MSPGMRQRHNDGSGWRLRAWLLLVLVAVPVLVLLVERAPITFYPWMRTDEQLPAGAASRQLRGFQASDVVR
jgi:hypothetical protein